MTEQEIIQQMMNNQQMGQQQLRISADQVSNATTLSCACGGQIFEEGSIFKKLSALISPSGREEMFPIQVIVCKKCGKVPAIFDKENIVPDNLKSKPLVNLNITDAKFID